MGNSTRVMAPLVGGQGDRALLVGKYKDGRPVSECGGEVTAPTNISVAISMGMRRFSNQKPDGRRKGDHAGTEKTLKGRRVSVIGGKKECSREGGLIVTTKKRSGSVSMNEGQRIMGG